MTDNRIRARNTSISRSFQLGAESKQASGTDATYLVIVGNSPRLYAAREVRSSAFVLQWLFAYMFL